VRLVEGSAPGCSTTSGACIFQNAGRRVAFAIPCERDFMLMGTMDVDFS
jgi:hypothetical protein